MVDPISHNENLPLPLGNSKRRLGDLFIDLTEKCRVVITFCVEVSLKCFSVALNCIWKLKII